MIADLVVNEFKYLATTSITDFKSQVKGVRIFTLIPDTVNLYVVIKEYLARLETEQLSKSKNDRLEIPNLKQIASEIGVSEKQFLRIANNQTRDIMRLPIARVIYVLRRRGFNTKETDIVKYVE